MTNSKELSGAALAARVSWITVAVNVILSAVKLAAGIFGNSSAMISDAFHSLSDVFSTFVVIVGVKLAAKEADHEHPYGHERLECAAAVILSVFLALAGIGIGISGIEKIAGGEYNDIAVPGILPIIAALLSITVKEWMYRYTRHAAVKLNSAALMADAWHHRSDSLSSIGAFVGIAFARMGLPIMDPAASAVISVFIVKAAYDIFRDGLDKMVDKSCSPETEEAIRSAVLSVEGVSGINDLKTRLFGSKIYVDMEIAVNGNLKLFEAHSIAQEVHDLIESSYPECKHCMVHLDPCE